MTLSLIRQGRASHQVGYFCAKSMPIGSDQYGLDKIRALNRTWMTENKTISGGFFGTWIELTQDHDQW